MIGQRCPSSCRLPRFLALVVFYNIAPTGAQVPVPTVTDPPAEIVWNQLEGSEPWPSDLLTREELPAAPDDLQPLLRLANLQLKFYDPVQFPRRFTGETRMALDYKLDFTYRWTVEREGRKRILVAELTHRPTRFTLYHQILLPIDHAAADLYTRPLVQHELDHVRISTDPRYRNLFEQWFQADIKTLKMELDRRATERDFAGLIQTAVQEHADQSFRRMLDLIHIRNRELDRLTKHGQQPLPADFFTDPRAPEPPPR